MPARSRRHHRRRSPGSRPASAALTCGSSRQVGLAQHQADVGIGDQEAVAVDDVRLALLADLDARHDVPDELEVDVGDGHRARCRRPSGCAIVMYGSVSLRKYTGPNHGWPRFALRNAGSCERSLPELDAVHAEARDRDLLAPVGVELRDVGDFRRLAQQLQELDAPQLDVARVELRQRGVARAAARSAGRTARCATPRRPPFRAAGWRARTCFPGTRSRC